MLACALYPPLGSHAGGRCSKALTQILAQTVSREADFSLELASAVRKGFLRANAEFLRKAERFSANDGERAPSRDQPRVVNFNGS